MCFLDIYFGFALSLLKVLVFFKFCIDFAGKQCFPLVLQCFCWNKQYSFVFAKLLLEIIILLWFCNGFAETHGFLLFCNAFVGKHGFPLVLQCVLLESP